MDFGNAVMHYEGVKLCITEQMRVKDIMLHAKAKRLNTWYKALESFRGKGLV